MHYFALALWLCPCQGMPAIGNPTLSRASQRLATIRGGDGAVEIPEGMNPLVVSSPVVAAAVCRDGIVLLACHHKILASPQQQQQQPSEVNDDSRDDDVDDSSSQNLFRDLPVEFGGPFRIQSLDLQGTALMTAGWRPHAHYFIAKAQELYKDENETVGSDVSIALLASQLSLLLATTAVGSDVSHILFILLVAIACMEHEK